MGRNSSVSTIQSFVVKYHFNGTFNLEVLNLCQWVCNFKFCSKNSVFGRPFFCKCQNPTESIILFVMRRGWSPWWCTTALAPTPAVDRGDMLIDLVVMQWRLWWSWRTCCCSISVIICLRVNHQAKSVTVPTGSFFSPNDFCVWPSKWVKVKLEQGLDLKNNEVSYLWMNSGTNAHISPYWGADVIVCSILKTGLHYKGALSIIHRHVVYEVHNFHKNLKNTLSILKLWCASLSWYCPPYLCNIISSNLPFTF